MSPKERGPGQPKNRERIEILGGSDNIYVAAIKTAMNDRGISLDEAVAIWEKDAKKDPSGFHHLESIQKAAAAIRLELENKK